MSKQTEMSRQISYTTPRPDVFSMVPATAMTILDIGCSNGALGASLRFARDGRRVVGIERDPAFAKEARRQLDEVICADLEQSDWSSTLHGLRFDCIILADVLEHLVDPGRQLSKACEFLNKGGVVVVSLPNIRHISALISIFFKGSFPQRERGIFDKTHLRWFTITDARKFVGEAGLKVEAENYSLRLGDKGGGLLNSIMRRLFGPFASLFPIREFFAYQFCLRATIA
jgi:2-polyprenyl-3-methyl-5-hydroxy-6-metoxy-1,4-benzoquinol methylase